MKTLAKLIRRYVLAAFGIVLLILVLNVSLYATLVVRYGNQMAGNGRENIARLAESFSLGPAGEPVMAKTANLEGWVWGMLLDDGGNVIWQKDLPETLNRHYTAGEIAGFTRWYLEDYPVNCYRGNCGLLVLAKPRGSIWKSEISIEMPVLQALLKTVGPAVGANLAVILLLCLLLGWRGWRALRAVAQGIDALAEGQPVQVQEKGIATELAQKVNAAGERLQRQNRLIARRDNARTSWVAGVSHDIRTPLAIIVGNAEQLAGDEVLPAEARQKAGTIAAQSLKIKNLIADLNLTSKLQYNAQPLRRQRCTVGVLLRGAVTDFCNGGGVENCEVELTMEPTAEKTVLLVDRALFGRALDNLLGNSARHNPGGCRIAVGAALCPLQDGNLVKITVEDDGTGYPPGVLAQLRRGDDEPGSESGNEAPGAPGRGDAADMADAPGVADSPEAQHILGLFVVEQIVAAHGGRTVFLPATPKGARAELYFPVEEIAEK